MNIKDLNKIDIKDLRNIDAGQLRSYLSGQPVAAIKILIVLLTAGALFLTYRSYTADTLSLETEITSQQNKLKAVNKFDETKKQLSAFTAGLPPPISENKLIELLSEIAFRSRVQIVSLAPSGKQSNSFVQLTKVNVTISSEDYANIVRFMQGIEHSGYALRVSGWSGIEKSPSQTFQRRGRNAQANNDPSTENKFIEATVNIETLDLKND